MMRGKQEATLPEPAGLRLTRELLTAFEHFNEQLFDGMLSNDTMVKLQTKAHSDGYYVADEFGEREVDGNSAQHDEIGVNLRGLANRTIEEILGTMVHQMAHMAEFRLHGGASNKSSYHTKVWAQLMKSIGLIPSTTDAPGGPEIGHHVHHYIEPGGKSNRPPRSCSRAASPCRSAISPRSRPAPASRRRNIVVLTQPAILMPGPNPALPTSTGIRAAAPA
jgi:SprT-like family